jgi:hypothetical protein
MDAIPMGPIRFSVRGKFKNAKARDINTALKLLYENDHTEFTLPGVKEYEVIVLE